jgi:hypothetical protein
MEWLVPTDVLEVGVFMALASYYHRFFEDFSKMVHIITSLQWKGNNFEWTKQYEMEFQTLKEHLSGACILVL